MCCIFLFLFPDLAKNQDGITASVGSGTSLNRRTTVKLVDLNFIMSKLTDLFKSLKSRTVR